MTAFRIRLLNAHNRLQTIGRAARPRIFVNSIPKTGTNLVVSLTRAYGRLTISGPIIARNGTGRHLGGHAGLVFGHVENLPSGLTSLGFDDSFLLVRQPEDYVLSLARYIQANQRHPAHRKYGGGDPVALITAIVEGVRVKSFVLEAIDRRYRQYLGGAANHGLKLVDFDDLTSGAPVSGAAAELMTYIGGVSFAESYDRMLAKSQKLSSTFRHSSRSTLNVTLSEHIRRNPAFQAASDLYDQYLPR